MIQPLLVDFELHGYGNRTGCRRRLQTLLRLVRILEERYGYLALPRRYRLLFARQQPLDIYIANVEDINKVVSTIPLGREGIDHHGLRQARLRHGDGAHPRDFARTN